LKGGGGSFKQTGAIEGFGPIAEKLRESIMKKYVMEFIGTFFLVYIVGLTVINTGIGFLNPNDP
jgi:hypothetical protein